MPRRSKQNLFGVRPSRSLKKLLGCGTLILLAVLAPVVIFFDKAGSLSPSSDTRVKSIGSYRTGKRGGEVLLIPSGLNRAQLISLAQDIHKRHPTRPYHLVDSEEGAKAFASWVDTAWEYPMPEQFVREHYIATIHNQLDDSPESLKWRLLTGIRQVNKYQAKPTIKIVSLE
jgi:hypothetical protein